MRRLLERRARQGLTYRELSEQSGVPASSLSWWSWKLRHEARSDGGFVELEVVDEGGGSGVEIELGSGHRVHVSPGFDEETLRRVVVVLSSC